jgi:hypothetical protein|mmetsp:Transcript_27658/g.45769  ORF Transcript_27658/g.45769 Transcript_27658/m.45769 type:complete len:153 (-) Transcript_27658:363-821(-)
MWVVGSTFHASYICPPSSITLSNAVWVWLLRAAACHSGSMSLQWFAQVTCAGGKTWLRSTERPWTDPKVFMVLEGRTFRETDFPSPSILTFKPQSANPCVKTHPAPVKSTRGNQDTDGKLPLLRSLQILSGLLSKKVCAQPNTQHQSPETQR